jgi:hypothetical protein
VGQNSSEDRPGSSEDRLRGAKVDPVLRAKYLDYCSARISEVFLSMTDEHTYELMEEAAREANLSPGSLGFHTMMKLVTRKLQRSVPLPDLETWSREYEQSPERYDPYLLGLWKMKDPALTDRQGDDR